MTLSAIVLLFGAAPAHAFLIITGTPIPSSFSDFTLDGADLAADQICAADQQQCTHTISSPPPAPLTVPTSLSLDLAGADAVQLADSVFYAVGAHDSGASWEIDLSLPEVSLPLAPAGSDATLWVDVWAAYPLLAPLLPPSGHLVIDDSHPDAPTFRAALLDSMAVSAVP